VRQIVRSQASRWAPRVVVAAVLTAGHGCCTATHHVNPLVVSRGALVHERIQAFLRNAFFVDNIAVDTSFLDAGIIDSVGVLELLQFLEEEFKIHVNDDELTPANLDSINAVVGFLLRKGAVS
jgi:acyl carrier protein